MESARDTTIPSHPHHSQNAFSKNEAIETRPLIAGPVLAWVNANKKMPAMTVKKAIANLRPPLDQLTNSAATIDPGTPQAA